MPGQRPDPTPEGELIRRAMVRKGVNAPDVAPLAGIGPGRWRHIVNGAQPLGGGEYNRVVGPAVTLARMAKAVDVTPEQLEEAGRADAAKVLREDLADEEVAPPREYYDEVLGEITDPVERGVWDKDRRSLNWRRGVILMMRDGAEEQDLPDELRRAAG